MLEIITRFLRWQSLIPIETNNIGLDKRMYIFLVYKKSLNEHLKPAFEYKIIL